MSTVELEPTYTCPSWCQNPTCRPEPFGEHYTDGTAISASGGSVLQHLVDRDWTAAHIPLVSLRGVYNPCDGDLAPSVSLLSNDGKNEAEVYLNIQETEALISALQSHMDLLQEGMPND